MIQEVELQCSIEEKDYIITFGSDGYFNCSNCSKDLQKELKNNLYLNKPKILHTSQAKLYFMSKSLDIFINFFFVFIINNNTRI
jgi:hypothetical protein